MSSADSPRTMAELEELRASWHSLGKRERASAFQELPRDIADDFFLGLDARDQCDLLVSLSEGERRIWMRLLAPDDAADLVQLASETQRRHLIDLLDDATRQEVTALLAYKEDQAGGPDESTICAAAA